MAMLRKSSCYRFDFKLTSKKLPSIEDRGQTDSVQRYHAHTHRALTFDLDVWPWLLIPGELWSWHTHTQTRTDRHTMIAITRTEVKMEIRHPEREPLSREFSAFVVTAELWRPELARPGIFRSNFCVFGKATPYGKIFIILFQKFSLPQDRRGCVEMS